MSVDFSIIDAGCCSQKNLVALYEQGISFLTRLKANFVLYKELIAMHAPGLEAFGNVVLYRDRLLYIKRVEILLGGYLGVCVCGA